MLKKQEVERVGTTLVANLDTLAVTRSIQQLLLDLVLRLDKIKRALASVCRVHSEIIQAFADLLDWEHYGSINRVCSLGMNIRKLKPALSFRSPISERRDMQ